MRHLRFLLILLLAPTTPLSAHEMSLADGRTADYGGLFTPNGASCCSDRDCRPVASRWRPDGVLEVETAPGAWRPVPPEAIIEPRPEQLWSTADQTHACWQGTVQKPRFLCVFPELSGS